MEGYFTEDDFSQIVLFKYLCEESKKSIWMLVFDSLITEILGRNIDNNLYRYLAAKFQNPCYRHLTPEYTLNVYDGNNILYKIKYKDIEYDLKFFKRAISKYIIAWEDSRQLGNLNLFG